MLMIRTHIPIHMAAAPSSSLEITGVIITSTMAVSTMVGSATVGWAMVDSDTVAAMAEAVATESWPETGPIGQSRALSLGNGVENAQ
jgi:hypothetical protein